MKPLELSPSQRAARDAVGNIVVIAGAGTGKTETLTQRVLRLLDEQECELHEIVALTFTDKAAGEMRQRIYQSLLQRLVAEDDVARRARLHALCAGFAEAHRIGTFDAFNNRLLSSHPEFGLVPQPFSPLSAGDERELHARTSRAFWNWIESLEARDPQRADLFLLLDDLDNKRALKLIADLASEETPHLEALARVRDEDEFRAWLREVSTRAGERIERRAKRKLNGLWNRYETALQRYSLPPELASTLTDAAQLNLRAKGILTQSGTFLKKWIRPEWKELCAQLEEELLPGLNLWRVAENALHETLQALWNVEENWQDDFRAQQVLARAAKLSKWWRAQSEEICRRESWLDFPDAHRAALQLLHEQPAVASRLRNQTNHVLVDEFQDTNWPQWELIAAFRRDDNVMLIGDGKQSIYSFRGGDITVFDEVRSAHLAAHETVSLALSQRATPQLCAFFNAVFEEVLPNEKDERETWEAPFQALQSARAQSDEYSDVYVLSATSPDEPQSAQDEWSDLESIPMEDASASQWQFVESATQISRLPRNEELLGEATALLLRELQDDSEEIARAWRETNSSTTGVITIEALEENWAVIQLRIHLRQPRFVSISRRLAANQAGTIGVLFRTHDRKAAFEAALKKQGVRYASVKGIGFFQSLVVRDAISLLRFFGDESDDLALAGVLRSPLVGASDIALLELRRFLIQNKSESLWRALQLRCSSPPREYALSDEDENALRLAGVRLKNWRDDSHIRRLSEVLESARMESEQGFSEALHPDLPQRIENWRKLLDMIRDRESKGRGGARSLTEYLEAQSQHEDKEADAALPEGGAIQLMTIYAAKGLGFEMTILAQNDGVIRSDAPLMRKGNLGVRDEMFYAVKFEDNDGAEREPVLWTILKEEELARREAEWARLFYVACTRAKDFLVLAMPDKIKRGSWAEMASPHLETKPRIGLHELRARDDERKRETQKHAASTPIAQRPFPKFETDLLRALPRHTLPKSASVTQFLELLRATSPREYSAPQCPKPRENFQAREQGSALHQLLMLRVEPDAARACSVALLHGLPSETAPVLLEQWRAAHRWLESKNCDASKARREASFTIPADVARTALEKVLAPGEAALLDGVEWISGQIDFLAPRRDENGNELWIVADFKSHAGDEALEVFVANRRYDMQLRIYLAAAKYLGVDAREAWLIVLDGSGESRELHVS